MKIPTPILRLLHQEPDPETAYEHIANAIQLLMAFEAES